jgi:acyl-CoA thioesterase
VITSEFDRAVAVHADGAGRVHGRIADGWDVGGTPNGGYVMAIGVQGLLTAVDQPDPLSVTAHYLDRAQPGPVEIDVERVRAGRRHETAVATMRQHDRRIVVLVATFTDLSDVAEEGYVAAAPPELPPPEESVPSLPAPGFTPPPVTERVALRLHPGQVGFALGKPNGVAEVSGWTRFADGREPDSASLPMFADALPPAVFNAGTTLGWVPTLEMTVQIRRRPAPGWLRGRFTTRFVSGSYLEEDGELWDAEGRLVALSRQLAMSPRGG